MKKSPKPLKEFHGSLTAFYNKISETNFTSNEIKVLGILKPEIIEDLRLKNIFLENIQIVVTDKKLAKYITHSKSKKGASIDVERLEEVQVAIENPISIYEDILTNEILYIYAHPYDDKFLKLLIQPNFIIKGNAVNLLKSIGIIEGWHFDNTRQFLKIK